jgi:hypothetical protein
LIICSTVKVGVKSRCDRLGLENGRAHGAGAQHLPHVLPIEPAFAAQAQAFGQHGAGLRNQQIDHQLHQPGLLGIAEVKPMMAPGAQQRLGRVERVARARRHNSELRGLGHFVVARHRGAQVLHAAHLAQLGHPRRGAQRHGAGVHVHRAWAGALRHLLTHGQQRRIVGQRRNHKIGLAQSVCTGQGQPSVLGQRQALGTGVAHRHDVTGLQEVAGHGQAHFAHAQKANLGHAQAAF